MEPVYQDGEVALIREGGFDYDGAVYAIAWNDQLYIKKVYLEEDGYRLVSINDSYPDKFAPAEDNPRIVGENSWKLYAYRTVKSLGQKDFQF